MLQWNSIIQQDIQTMEMEQKTASASNLFAIPQHVSSNVLKLMGLLSDIPKFQQAVSLYIKNAVFPKEPRADCDILNGKYGDFHN
jgi:hypothetical protein